MKLKLVSTLVESNGLEKAYISCGSSNVTSFLGYDAYCTNALYWNSSRAFVSYGTTTQTLTLSFPKTYVSVRKIQIRDGLYLRYLNASKIESSLDGKNYKHIMNTNLPFCAKKSEENCGCDIDTIREYVFPEERILKYLRISSAGKDTCGTMELSFYGIELYGYFTSVCISGNRISYFSFPFFAYAQFLFLK